MKISNALFFAYVFALMIAFAKADEFSWIPLTVVTIETQCRRRHFVGLCSDRGPRPRTPDICTNAHCARGNGDYQIFSARSGTVCGPAAICHRGRCTPIPADRVPHEVGFKTTASCIIVPPRARA